MKQFKGHLLIVITLINYSCSSKKEEPIFHLFEHSTRYPNHDEIEYLQEKGFKIKISEDTIYLAGTKKNIELLFILDSNKNDIFTKLTRVYIEKFDTLYAETKIKNSFEGKKLEGWKKINDTTYSVVVNYEKNDCKVFLKKEIDRSFLETRFDFFHRVINN